MAEEKWKDQIHNRISIGQNRRSGEIEFIIG
jgi:hypothetical protein